MAIPDGLFVVGNKLMGRCAACGKIIRWDKPIAGSLHFCMDETDLQIQDMIRRQRDALSDVSALGIPMGIPKDAVPLPPTPAAKPDAATDRSSDPASAE